MSEHDASERPADERPADERANERPADERPADGRHVDIGETVYDGDGNVLGTVRGVDPHGFYVTSREGVLSFSMEHEAGSTAGEKELMWRCWNCGEMGPLTELPERCPNCGAPGEELYFWRED